MSTEANQNPEASVVKQVEGVVEGAVKVGIHAAVGAVAAYLVAHLFGDTNLWATVVGTPFGAALSAYLTGKLS